MSASPAIALDDAIAVWCERHYGLRDVQVQRELTGGMFARPLLLSSERGAFVYRTHRFRPTEQSFRFQADVVATAAHLGMASPILLTSGGNHCVVDPNGEGVIALHAYAEGWQYDWEAWREMLDASPDFVASLGAAVATMHNALATSQPAGNATLPCDLPPVQLAQLDRVRAAWDRDIERLASLPELECETARNTLLAQRDLLADCWDKLTEWSAEVPHLARQPVHGDISPVNLVWSDGTGPVFIDWDATHLGHRLYDALGDVLHRAPATLPETNRLRLDHLHGYLNGYAAATARQLSPAELAMIPAFTLARQLEDLRQRVAVLPTLPVASDAQYARLIEMRSDMLCQILATTDEAWRAAHPNS